MGGGAKVAFLQVVQPSKIDVRHELKGRKKPSEKILVMLMINNGIKIYKCFIN